MITKLCRVLAADCLAATTFAAPGLTQDIKRVRGADLFTDLQEYAGKPVILTDGLVFGATNSGALVTTGDVTFSISVQGIDRESFRFFLTNCSDIMEQDCKVPLVVTPTGKFNMEWPVLKDVRIAR